MQSENSLRNLIAIRIDIPASNGAIGQDRCDLL